MGNVVNKIVKFFKTCWNPTARWEEDTCSSSDSDIESESGFELSNHDNRCMFTINNPKKALLIGINYYDTENELSGCINDVIHLKSFIKENLHFNNSNIMIMRDDYAKESMLYPNEFNIKKQIEILVEWANNNVNAEIWFSYSGHGSYLFDTNGDEDDFQDEVLCTVDNKYIKDDWIKKNFIDLLNPNVKLFILIDACHSGTMCDLTNDVKKIVMFSGCKDDQTSADAYIREENEFRGALTHSFLTSWNKDSTFIEHHNNLLDSMNGKYTQKSVITYTCPSLNDYQLC